MRASVVAALAAGGVAVGMVTATTVSVGSSSERGPLTPIVVEAPQSVAPTAGDSSAPTAPGGPAIVPSDTHAPQADGIPAPPPALLPDERAGFKISDSRPSQSGGWDGDWADDTGDDTWDDTWDDSYDDWDDD